MRTVRCFRSAALLAALLAPFAPTVLGFVAPLGPRGGGGRARPPGLARSSPSRAAASTSTASTPRTRGVPPRRPPSRSRSTSLSAAEGDDGSVDPIDVAADPRLRRVRLSRALGVDWGTDLSFSFVYVRDLEPSGAASLSGEVEPGDQICELTPVAEDAEPANLIGAPFDEVMNAFASLGREVRDVDLVFFRGTKEELKALCAGEAPSVEDQTISITVIQNKGSKDETVRVIEAEAGCNVRQVLTDHGINVYQSVTRWTNCKGKQLCGTCIVNVAEGGEGTNRKSLDEASTLRENPDGYRLSCVTFAYGDVTVETFPPVKAAQWTR